MKRKLLFAAALVAAGVAGTQAVRLANSSWNLQLLENQQLGGVNPLAEEETTDDPDAGSDATEDALPTPLAFYDFEEDDDRVQLKTAGTGTLPYSIPLSEKETGLQFTFGLLGNEGYAQIANPLLNNANVATAGATISLWVYRDDSNAYEYIWSFNGDQMMQFNGNGYLGYNNQHGAWFDFNHPNTGSYTDIPVEELAMVTLTFGTEEIGYYVNGEAKAFSGFSGGNVAGLDSYQAAYKNAASTLLGHMTTATEFYLGKGYWWWGTFPGKADKLGFYDKALTADEVKALYDSQKDAYANPVDLNAKEDVTAQYIVNADFSDAEDMYKGWTNEGMPCDATISTEQGMPFMNENPGTANFDFYQVLNVPNGIYTVSAQCLTHVDTKKNYNALRLYANDKYTIIPQNGSTWDDEMATRAIQDWAGDKELNRLTVSSVMVTDGTLRIGVSKSARKGFVCFDNFRLEKASLNDMMSAYNNLKADAEALDGAKLQSDLKARLDAALADEPTDFTVDAYTEACFALQAAYDVCNYYLANCTGLTDYIAACEADIAGSTGDAAALNSAISAIEGIDWTTVTAAGLQQAYEQLVGEHHAYQSAATPVGDYQFDMTWLLTNPKSTGATTGWYCNVMGGDAGRENTNVGWSSSASYRGDADVAGFIEKWSTNIMSPGEDGNGWLLYQQALLPAGAYKLTALAFTDMPFNATTTGDNPVTGEAVANLSMGFGSTVKVDGEAFDWQEHGKYTGEVPAAENKNQLKLMTIPYFYLGEAATAENPVKLGINIKEGNKADWFGINDMKLYKVAPQAVELSLDEASDSYSVEPNTYANVTMARKLGAGKWNTFCVPFDMTADQLTANKITKVVQLTAAETTADNGINLTSTDVTDGVKAGVPYLVQVSEDVTEITAEGVYVTAAAPAAQTIGTAGDYTVAITGNYSAQNVPTNAYFISNNTFYVADAEATVPLKGFRAYITLTDDSGEPAQANVRTISIDGNTAGDGTTGIEGVSGETADQLVDVYTLSGVKVKGGVKASEALDGLQRGVYIVNGKKIIK